MQRKHAKLIKQWADDNSLVVEVHEDDGSWNVVSDPVWMDWAEYRITKPEPKKIKFLAYIIAHQLVWLKDGEVISPRWIRIPSEDKEITLPCAMT